MHVGYAKFKLLLRGARTLKEKRQVVRSMKDRIFNSWKVAVSEVDLQDICQSIVLGVAVVGTDAVTVQSLLEEITQAMRVHPQAEFVSVVKEVLKPELVA